ncbi:MAG: FAD-binding oxidoreductase [Saprospiraceae bacterium]|nr:FAD-binding oxidoreductase [Saprospiraceae bacterium]
MQVDTLIVGQGLAGTLLAHFLIEAGQTVCVIDDDYPRAATRVAAGVINPVTGRSFVKSWRVDELIPFARQTYQQLESLLGLPLYHERNIIRALSHQGDENDWLGRSADPAYHDYIIDPADVSAFTGKINPAFSYGELQHASQVDIGRLCAAFRSFLINKNSFQKETFDYNKLEISISAETQNFASQQITPPTPEGETLPHTVASHSRIVVQSQSRKVAYQGITAASLVFAEGAKAIHNPYFSYLPFIGDKGEVLIVKIPGARFPKMLKQGVFVIPFGKPEEELYWIGTTYERNFEHDDPSPQSKATLIDQLNEVLTLPFEVVDHLAAIRPTVKDRRPFLGFHPQFEQLAIFNGLGTKGTSLAPFWAKHLADRLVHGSPLDRQVDIARFLTHN